MIITTKAILLLKQIGRKPFNDSQLFYFSTLTKSSNSYLSKKGIYENCLPSTDTQFSGITVDRQTIKKEPYYLVPLKYSMSIQRDPSIVTTILPTVTYCGPDETFTKHLQSRLKSLDTSDQETTDPETKPQNNQDDKSNNNGLYYEYENQSPGSPVDDDNTTDNIDSTFINGCCKEETYCNSLCIDKQCTLEVPDGDEEDECGEEITIPRVRRCSSLKSGKTPPGTPGQKKIVRFADVLGLDLADVRTYLDEVPKIPTSAYEDLCDLIPDLCIAPPKNDLVPLFQQPGGESDFLDRVRQRQCCLENACVQDEMTIAGTVRVRNIDFSKSVHIRYSLDAWKTYSDLKATYVPNSCDGFSDKFSFVLYCHTLDVGQRIEFAVRYSTSGMQFWDNNNGVNYCFQCLPAVNNTGCIPIQISSDEHWADKLFY